MAQRIATVKILGVETYYLLYCRILVPRTLSDNSLIHTFTAPEKSGPHPGLFEFQSPEIPKAQLELETVAVRN